MLYKIQNKPTNKKREKERTETYWGLKLTMVSHITQQTLNTKKPELK